MKKNFILFFISAVLIWGCQEIESKKDSNTDQKNLDENHCSNTEFFVDSAYVSFETNIELKSTIFRNINYGFQWISYNGKRIETIFKHIHRVQHMDGVNGVGGNHTISFYDKNSKKHILDINERGNKIDLFGDFYAVHSFGCCGAEDEGVVKSYEKPDTLIEYTNSFFAIENINTREKYFVGFMPSDRYYNNGKYKLNEGLQIGTLHIYHYHGVKESIIYHAKDKKTYQSILDWTPEMNVLSTDGKRENRQNDKTFFHVRITEKDNHWADFQIIFLNEFVQGESDTIEIQLKNHAFSIEDMIIHHDTISFSDQIMYNPQTQNPKHETRNPKQVDNGKKTEK